MLCVGEDADGAVPRQGTARRVFGVLQGGADSQGESGLCRFLLELPETSPQCLPDEGPRHLLFPSLVKKIRMDLRCHIRKTTV